MNSPKTCGWRIQQLAFVSTALSLLLSVVSSAETDTAYGALRVVGKSLGEDMLNRVTQVHGSKGTWKLTVSDSSADGVVRRIRVRDSRILSDNTFKEQAASGSAIPFDRLNLDSDGVLATIRQQPEMKEVDANQLEYTLAASTDSSAPVWTVTWADARAGKRSVMQIAADTGQILGIATLPLAEMPPEQSAPKDEAVPRSRRVARGRPDVLGEIAEHVDRPARLVRRILPF